MTDSTATNSQPATPRYQRVANACGLLALINACLIVFYYGLVVAGAVRAPHHGLPILWTAAIILFAAVKISQWSADASAQRTHDLVEELAKEVKAELSRVSDEALERAQKAGYWMAVHEIQKSETEGGEVVSIGSRRNGVR